MDSDRSNRIRLHRILLRTRVEGPGERACIWVQGCTIRCVGCAVPWTWAKSAGEERCVASICEEICAEPGLEGITFLGGEPFEQAESVAAIARFVRRKGMGVVTFSGYTKEHLARGEQPGWLELLAETDLLIDGPYEQSQHDLSRPWVGSTNKRYHFLTSRYSDRDVHPETYRNKVEIRIGKDGVVRINGMLGEASLREVSAGIFNKPQ